MTLYYKKKVKAHTRTINGKKIKVKGFFKKDNTLNKGLLSAGVGTLAGAGLLALPASRTLIKKGLKKGFKTVDKQYGKYRRNQLAKLMRKERAGKVTKRDRKVLARKPALSIKDPLAAAYRDRQARKQGVTALTDMPSNGTVKQIERKILRNIEIEGKRASRKRTKKNE